MTEVQNEPPMQELEIEPEKEEILYASPYKPAYEVKYKEVKHGDNYESFYNYLPNGENFQIPTLENLNDFEKNNPELIVNDVHNMQWMVRDYYEDMLDDWNDYANGKIKNLPEDFFKDKQMLQLNYNMLMALLKKPNPTIPYIYDEKKGVNYGIPEFKKITTKSEFYEPPPDYEPYSDDNDDYNEEIFKPNIPF